MKYTHVILDHFGGPDVLHLQEDDVPEPKAGEVRIEILATDVSFSTVLMQHGQYPGTPAVPFTPGYDLVGRVDTIGPQVSGIEPGQLVAALTVYGSYRTSIRKWKGCVSRPVLKSHGISPPGNTLGFVAKSLRSNTTNQEGWQGFEG